MRLLKGGLPRDTGQFPQAAHLVLEGDTQTPSGQERGQGVDMVGRGMDTGHTFLPGVTLQHGGRLRCIDGGQAVIARSAGMDIAHAVPQSVFRFGQVEAVAPVPGIARAGDDAQIRAACFQGAQQFMRTRGIAADMIRQTACGHIKNTSGYRGIRRSRPGISQKTAQAPDRCNSMQRKRKKGHSFSYFLGGRGSSAAERASV